MNFFIWRGYRTGHVRLVGSWTWPIDFIIIIFFDKYWLVYLIFYFLFLVCVGLFWYFIRLTYVGWALFLESLAESESDSELGSSCESSPLAHVDVLHKEYMGLA